MPSRPVILAIIAFWLASTTWLIYREVLPTLQSREPPPYTIDLADEVSAQSISWEVRDKGKENFGTVQTQVRRQPDHNFILSAEYKPNNLDVLGLRIKELSSRYTVTRAGDLRELEITLESFKIGDETFRLKIEGHVEKGLFTPSISGAKGLPPLQPVAVAGHGNVLNPLHPLNRLKGLRANQQWVQPLFDPLAIAVSSMAGSGLLSPPMRQLHAEVMLGVLYWNGTPEVPCWKIEYRDENNRVVARTWVRREDGQVLQQDANHAGRSLLLKRIPAH
jgi:hypothetical protein